MVAYLNCELTGRDLDSRLLVATHLLAAGEPVVIGRLWSICMNAPQSPRGVFLFATANVHQARMMARCRMTMCAPT